MQGEGSLWFTVGLPRSGKSTLCANWVNEPLWNKYLVRPRVVVGGDDFRFALTGQNYVPAAEGMVFSTMDVAAAALLNRGFDVIIDETCTTEATLLRYLRIDQNATPMFIDTPADVCVRRAREDGKEYLVGPIGRMDAQLKKLMADWDGTVARLKAYLDSRKGHDIIC